MRDDDDDKQLDTTDMRRQVDSFLNSTMDARYLSQRDRDYYDGYQWTENELNTLNMRRQVPITVNRVKPKVEGLKGLLEIRKSDIKAYPRNRNDDEAASAVTDALRYVSDMNDFETISADGFENLIIEGYEGAIVEVVQNARKDIDVAIHRIPFDRIYFDPHSVKKDFSDCRFMGQIIWMDFEELEEKFPNVQEDDFVFRDGAGFEWDSQDTFGDKPHWFIREQDRLRVRIAQHFYIYQGKWYMCHFSGETFITEPELSPFLDEFGEPCCPIELQSCYIDRENRRYGEVRAFIDMQREINHRRSKALHLLSSRQTMATRGAIENVEALKRELAKPDGHIEVTSPNIGDAFQVMPTNDFTAGQFQLYQDAKGELDSQSVNAQLSGERGTGDLSGRAIDRLQSAGALEVNSLFKAHSHWKKRIFRQVWARIKQYWDEEKWVRITDDENNLRWVGFNIQIPMQKFLEETINDKSKPLNIRTGASAAYQKMMQAQSPELQKPVMTKNRPCEMDVDIILDECIDVVNIQQEQFQILSQFAQSSQDIDIIELIELSQLRGKKELIEKIEARRNAAAQQANSKQNQEAQHYQVKNAELYAKTQLTTQKANQTAIENQILLHSPPDAKPQVEIDT